MTTPATASPIVVRAMAEIPAAYADADAALGFPLLSYLQCLLGPLQTADTLVDRFAYIPPDVGMGYRTSDLVDPATADAGWLPWLAAIVGVTVPPGGSTADWRAAIEASDGGHTAGTAASIAAAAATVLTGSQTCVVLPCYGGNAWVIGLQCILSEAPAGGSAAIIAAVLAADVVPAGHALTVTYYDATWGTLDTVYPTWATRDGLTWSALESTPAP